MGIFGNFGRTMDSISTAFTKIFTTGSIREGTLWTGIFLGSAYFVKESVSAVSSSVFSFFDTFKKAVMLVAYGEIEEIETSENDQFDEDIEQANKDMNNYSSPLATIDTQNKIWLKIITREK